MSNKQVVNNPVYIAAMKALQQINGLCDTISISEDMGGGGLGSGTLPEGSGGSLRAATCAAVDLCNLLIALRTDSAIFPRHNLMRLVYKAGTNQVYATANSDGDLKKELQEQLPLEMSAITRDLPWWVKLEVEVEEGR